MSQNFDFWSNKTPFSIFVDPATHLGFVGDVYHRGLQAHIADQDDPNGTLARPYIDRLRQVCSFYTHLTDVGDIRDEAGTYYTGWTGFLEAHAATPPEDRRNVMIEVQEKWAVKALESPNFYATNINPANVAGVTFGYGQDTFYYDPANASGITLPAIPEEWRRDSSAIIEFSRQANMGVSYLSGGLTPGSAGTTMGTFKSVAKRFYKDLAEYLRSRGTDNIIHYSSFGTDLLDGNTGGASVPKIGLRSDLASEGKSWWRRSFWHPNLSDSMTYAKEKGILRDLADASLSADMYGGSVLNWCPNIGSDIAYAWYAPVDRLVDAGGGLSSAAASKFSLNDLSYWAARGSAALMHEFYGYADSLATSMSNPSYRKGLSMVVQLDSPVVAQAGALGGGAFAAQKWGYMKDPDLAADIDIFGAFGATDANVPNMRKPDQIWVRSSSVYNNKLLFESGTGNYADASSLGYPDDNFTAHFAVLTARSQLEKRLFKRDMMLEDEAILLGNSNQFIPNESSTQEERLQWLEDNTLPNVYWDARIGEQYSEGASNNIRFWSGATGNCLPAPCVFDRTSPIAAFLNMNNDIHKNEVRVAIKKWVSEEQTSTIETTYKKLNSIYFTPVVQKKQIPLFVDPDLMVAWDPSDSAYQSSTKQYFDRILKVATPYTYITYGTRAFSNGDDNRADFVPTTKYFDAIYGVSAHAEEQTNYAGTSYQQQIFTNGIRGGKSLFPVMSRAVMFNAEYPWLTVFGSSNRTDTLEQMVLDIGMGITANVVTPTTTAEFQRQASLGAEYLFPEIAPIGGFTSGSLGADIMVWRNVGARLFNDLIYYATNNNTFLNRAKNVIHYASVPNRANYGAIRSGAREETFRNIPPYRSYWTVDNGPPYLITYDQLYDRDYTTRGNLEANHAAQASGDTMASPFYNLYPCHPNWAEGATFGFTDFNVTNRKFVDGQLAPSNYSWSDLLYWQSKEAGNIIGNAKDNLLSRNYWKKKDQQKMAIIFTPQYSTDALSVNGILPFQWNHWSGGRKDPQLAAQLDISSSLAQVDSYNPKISAPDEVWVWDAAITYWFDYPTRSILVDASGITMQIAWARNALEKMLFNRPSYPDDLKQLIESDGLSMAANSGFRSSILQRQGNWIFDNCLTDGWWSRHPLGTLQIGGGILDSRTWYDPNSSGNKLPSPCVLDQTSPLAPWLNFDQAITTGDIHNALRHYISDYNCRYVEGLKKALNNAGY